MSDFWTRRRAQVQAETAQEREQARALDEQAQWQAEAARQAELTEPELLAELGLPDPESLKAGDDFTAFLRREVPEFLRRRALRRLWTSNPVLANLDGLVDHGDDFTDAATVKPGMRTAYQVGRGMVERIRSEAETLLAATEDTPEAAPDLAPPSSVRRPTAARVTMPPQPVAAPVEPAGPTVLAEAVAEMPAPRHMQFQFVEAPA